MHRETEVINNISIGVSPHPNIPTQPHITFHLPCQHGYKHRYNLRNALLVLNITDIDPSITRDGWTQESLKFVLMQILDLMSRQSLTTKELFAKVSAYHATLAAFNHV